MAWVRCCGSGNSTPQGWIDVTDTFSPALGNLVDSNVGSYLSVVMNNAKWVRLTAQYAWNNASDCSLTLTAPNTTFRAQVGGVWKDFEFDNTAIKITSAPEPNRIVVKKIYVSYDTIMPTPVPPLT